MGENCPRSDPDVAPMDQYLGPNMQEYELFIWICATVWPPKGIFVSILPVYCYGGYKHTPLSLGWRPSNLLDILSQGVIGHPTIHIKAGKRLDGRHPFISDVTHLILGLKSPLGHPTNNLLVCENHKAYIAQV